MRYAPLFQAMVPDEFGQGDGTSTSFFLASIGNLDNVPLQQPITPSKQ